MKFIVDNKIKELAAIFMEECLASNQSRINHLYASAECAKKLAQQIGENEDNAYFAALLHDIGKHANKQYVLSKFEQYHIEDPFLLANYELGHGDTSAIMTYEKFKQYGLKYESDIINAIRFHTFGRANMSYLEKIVYAADLIEPNRNYNGVDRLRQLIKSDFNNGIYEICADNLRFLISKRIIIHPNALAMLNSLIE